MSEDRLNLETICNGGVPEVFERELGAILENIADVNTDPEAARKITLEFTFKPFKDRSGSAVKFQCKSKIAPVEEVGGQMFVHRRGTTLTAIAHDPKQARMFEGKTAASGDRKEIQ